MENFPRVLRYGDYPVTPWKNGRGVTREVVTEAAGGTGSGFGWRLSMAEISEDAPFSSYPGIERHLAVVAGGALELVVEGARQRMRVGDPAITFPGDASVSGRPLDGPVTDLNLMLDQMGWSGSLEPLSVRRHQVDGGSIVVVSIAQDVGVRVSQASGTMLDCVLGRLDSLVVAASEPITLEFESPGPTAVFGFLARATRL